MTDYQIWSLGDMLSYGTAHELLEARFKEFRCSRDPQLERFLREAAITYEQRGFGRTYLILDPRSQLSTEIPPIAAFFTLAITATDYSMISKNKREKVLGSKPGRDTFRSFGGVLIGQLARDDRYGSSFISGTDLLLQCERYIEMGRKYIGGSIVYLDCKEALINTYQKSHYKLLTNEPSGDGYFKMYKVLPDKYL